VYQESAKFQWMQHPTCASTLAVNKGNEDKMEDGMQLDLLCQEENKDQERGSVEVL
jgi:hypothetical protein